MSDYLHREYGYLIECGEDNYDAVSSDALESYLRKYVKVFADEHGAVYVSHEDDSNSIKLIYTIDKTDCVTCEEAEQYDGICEGHGEPHYAWVYYKRADIYAHPAI